MLVACLSGVFNIFRQTMFSIYKDKPCANSLVKTIVEHLHLKITIPTELLNKYCLNNYCKNIILLMYMHVVNFGPPPPPTPKTPLTNLANCNSTLLFDQ